VIWRRQEIAGDEHYESHRARDPLQTEFGGDGDRKLMARARRDRAERNVREAAETGPPGGQISEALNVWGKVVRATE